MDNTQKVDQVVESGGHMPSFLNKSVTENNMILSKENRQMTALSGSSGFGNQKPDFEVDIRSADLLDGSSLQLRGEIQTIGDYAANCNFCSSGYSMVDQISIELNGQNYLILNGDADVVAHLNRTLHSSNTQFENDNVLALEGVNLTTKQSFCLDLSKYGSSLQQFIATAPVASLKIRIRFQTNLRRLFHGTDGGAGNDVDGYTISNLHLCADFMTTDAGVKNALIKRMQNDKGVHMSTHSFIPQRTELRQGATNHVLQNSFQYRNVVSMFYVPIVTSIADADTWNNISKTDIISNVSYTGGQLPTRMLVRMSGSNYVNQNSQVGCSTKAEHLTSMLKASMRTPEESNIGYNLCQGYKDNSYQTTGVSFVRGNDNLVDITNSGVNGYFSRGVLETSFDTSVAQVNKTMLAIGVITTVVSIENGQVKIIR